jgi:hypothetical protein
MALLMAVFFGHSFLGHDDWCEKDAHHRFHPDSVYLVFANAVRRPPSFLDSREIRASVSISC